MKKRFFKFVQIDNSIIKDFCEKHPAMHNFIDESAPFHVRVGIKPYPTLIHTIITNRNDAVELINFRLETLAKKLKDKITPKTLNKISYDGLKYMLGEENAETISAITKDILLKKLNLKRLVKKSELDIQLALASYPKMTLSIIKSFSLFGCFKQNVYCCEEKEFINGLKIFLNKNTISKEDIDNISKEYNGQLTLFSLCMFRLNNEKGNGK